MKILIAMQKSNDGGKTIIGKGSPDEAFAHALKLLSIQGNDPNKILQKMKTATTKE